MAMRTTVSNKLTTGIRILNSILSSSTPDRILVMKLTAPLGNYISTYYCIIYLFLPDSPK